jgi:methylisocitrate lyase
MSSQKLRELIQQPDIVVIPKLYDCLGAKLVEQSGFKVAAISGFGIAASTIVLLKYGFLRVTEVLYSICPFDILYPIL